MRSLLSAVVPTLALSLIVMTERAEAAQNDPATDWLKNCRVGVFMHFLPRNPHQFSLVERFDATALADQLAEMGAKYFIFTMYQNSGWMNAPCAAYDHMTGYRPGERCAQRDLPLDLHQALSAKGIRLLLYVTGQTPNADARAQTAFGLPATKADQKIDVAFAAKWAGVLQEWSDRYGD